MSTPFDELSDLRLEDARTLQQGAETLIARALERARALTGTGKTIDEHQVTTERVAYAATECRAARELVAQVEGIRAEGRGDRALELLAIAGTAELVTALRARIDAAAEALGLGEGDLDAAFPAALR